VAFTPVLANFSSNGRNDTFTISGTVTTGSGVVPISGSGTITTAPSAGAVLDGVAVLAQTKVVTGTVTGTGPTGSTVSVPLSSTGTMYSNPSNYAEIAEDIAGDEYLVYSPSYAYPATVTAGSAGVLGTVKIYSNNTKTTQTGTENDSYVVAADSATTLLITFTSDRFDMANTRISQSQETWRISTSGSANPVRGVQTLFPVGGQEASTLNITFN
jgi:hypothetical protein